MDTGSLFKYAAGMEQIECQEALMGFNISSYPHLEKNARTKLHRKVHSKAMPKDQKPLSMEDLAGILNG